MGCDSIVDFLKSQRIKEGEDIIPHIVFTGVDEHGFFFGGDQDAFSLTDINDVDLSLTGGRQCRGRGGRTAIKDAVDGIHAFGQQRGVQPHHIAAKGQDT